MSFILLCTASIKDDGKLTFSEILPLLLKAKPIRNNQYKRHYMRTTNIMHLEISLESTCQNGT